MGSAFWATSIGSSTITSRTGFLWRTASARSLTADFCSSWSSEATTLRTAASPASCTSSTCFCCTGSSTTWGTPLASGVVRYPGVGHGMGPYTISPFAFVV